MSASDEAELWREWRAAATGAAQVVVDAALEARLRAECRGEDGVELWLRPEHVGDPAAAPGGFWTVLSCGDVYQPNTRWAGYAAQLATPAAWRDAIRAEVARQRAAWAGWQSALRRASPR